VKNKQDLTERLLSGELVYDGALLKVRRDVVRLPDGREASREYVRHPGAVAVVALFPDGRVLLERQYRHPLAREFLELPAGKLEPGEPHLETAKRELLEETGYAAAEWRVLGRYHPSNGSTNQVFHVTIARALDRRSEPLDTNETLGLGWFTPGDVRELLLGNEILDGLSLTALSWGLIAGAIA